MIEDVTADERREFRHVFRLPNDRAFSGGAHRDGQSLS